MTAPSPVQIWEPRHGLQMRKFVIHGEVPFQQNNVVYSWPVKAHSLMKRDRAPSSLEDDAQLQRRLGQYTMIWEIHLERLKFRNLWEESPDAVRLVDL